MPKFKPGDVIYSTSPAPGWIGVVRETSAYYRDNIANGTNPDSIYALAFKRRDGDWQLEGWNGYARSGDVHYYEGDTDAVRLEMMKELTK